jgi:hypothetical protein
MTRRIEVQKAVTIGRNGQERADGWDVLVDGEWHDRFPTRREAKAEAAKIAAR